VLDIKDTKIAVIGMGYVGLPLALVFEKLRSPMGSGINESIQRYGISTHVLMDIKAVFPKSQGILRI